MPGCRGADAHMHAGPAKEQRHGADGQVHQSSAAALALRNPPGQPSRGQGKIKTQAVAIVFPKRLAGLPNIAAFCAKYLTSVGPLFLSLACSRAA